MLRQLQQQFLVLRRPDETDQARAFAHHFDFVPIEFGVELRRTHLEDQVGGRPDRLGILGYLGAGFAINVVGKTRAVAGAGLDDDLESGRDQLFRPFPGVAATRRSPG